MDINEMIRKWNLVLSEKDGKKGIRVLGKATQADIEILKKNKDEIIAELERKKEVEKAIEAQKKADREEEIRAIKAGEKTITIKWTDGEYLQAYEAFGEAGNLLEELGIAKYIDGWGVRVDQKLVEALGEEFTYQQAFEFTQPKRDQETAKEAQKKAELEKKFAEAKRTGKKVEIFRTTAECNNPKIECSLDIIIIWAMPNGTQKEERIHTY